MIRNLKALGLVLAAVFAIGAVIASAASAEPAKFTAAVSVTETVKIHGGQTGADTFTLAGLGAPVLTCATATLSGQALTKGPEPTEVTLSPTYTTCHAIVTILGVKVTRTATVAMNGCGYRLNATKNTGGSFFSADLTIECPVTEPEPWVIEEHQIEIHVYNTSTASDVNASEICRYDIRHQTINNAIELTNVAGAPNDILAHVKEASVVLTDTIPNSTCGSVASATYKGTDTLTATNQGGVSVNSSVS